VKKKTGKPARRHAARKSTRAKPARRAAAPAAPGDDLTTVREELAEARAELARIASGENTARRDLEARVSAASSVEERLRAELEEMRMDLRTALAELEITRADQERAESRLGALVTELDGLRESERLATHASTDAGERLRDLRGENETLRKHLFDANEQLRKLKEPKEPTA
jgi:chromosome segregation ATPase